MSVTLLDQQKGKVAKEGLLGRLLWFSVPEATILDHQAVIDQLKAVGLDQQLPGMPADHDVFRRVTSLAERRKVPHNGKDNEFENWLIRDVASRGEDTITRRIVCEVVDPRGRKLSYAQVADIEFVRPVVIPDRRHEYDPKIAEVDAAIAKLPPTHRSRRAQLLQKRLNLVTRQANLPAPMNRPSRLNFVWLDNNNEIEYPTAKDIMTDVAVQFAKWKGKLGDDVMRRWIRLTVLSMGATPVRPSGGIYFLEERFADKVEALEGFCATFLPQGGECHSVEIPDTDKQRDMIHRAIEAETVGAIERKTAEITQIRREGRLTGDKYVEMMQEVSALQKKMKGYSDLLERDLSAVESRLELLAMQTKSLARFQKERGEK